jgi:hypothetical protein
MVKKTRACLTPMLLLWITLIFAGCYRQESPSLPTATPAEFQRDFPVLEGPDLTPTLAEHLEIVSVPSMPSSGQEDTAINPNRTFQAYTFCDEQSCKLIIEELGDDQFYELRGPFLTWRPFSGLTWLNNDILAFDQWSNPHYGIHYQINFLERRLVSATGITDIVH